MPKVTLNVGVWEKREGGDGDRVHGGDGCAWQQEGGRGVRVGAVLITNMHTDYIVKEANTRVCVKKGCRKIII